MWAPGPAWVPPRGWLVPKPAAQLPRRWVCSRGSRPAAQGAPRTPPLLRAIGGFRLILRSSPSPSFLYLLKKKKITSRMNFVRPLKPFVDGDGARRVTGGRKVGLGIRICKTGGRPPRARGHHGPALASRLGRGRDALGGVGQQPLASPRGWSPAGSQLSIPTNMQREEKCASCPRDAGGGRL